MLNVKANQLGSALAKVAGVIDPRHINVGLQRCRMFVQNGKLAFLGSNSTVEVEYISDIAWKSEVDILVDIKKLTDLCKLQGDELLTLKVRDNLLEVSKGKSEWTFNVLRGADFPRIDRSSEKLIEAKVPVKFMSEMLSLSDHAMANNDIREFLNGTLFEFKEDKFNIVATDGHRLVFNSLNLGQKAIDESKQIILPKVAIKEVRSLLSSIEGDIEIMIYENFVLLQNNGVKLISKFINSKYPDYEKVIPVLSERFVEFEPKAFKVAVQGAEINADKLSFSIGLEIKDKELYCNAKDDINDKGKDYMELTSSNVSDFAISFNSKYLLDICSVLGSHTTKMYVNSSEASVLFAFENKNFLTKIVLMPIRV